MARDITITSRELTPFEILVLGLLCEGYTNLRMVPIFGAGAFICHFYLGSAPEINSSTF
jgi:hypothetical protein